MKCEFCGDKGTCPDCDPSRWMVHSNPSSKPNDKEPTVIIRDEAMDELREDPNYHKHLRKVFNIWRKTSSDKS